MLNFSAARASLLAPPPFCVFASADGNSPNHNLQQYLHNIDPTRDVALMNKVGGVKNEIFRRNLNFCTLYHEKTVLKHDFSCWCRATG